MSLSAKEYNVNAFLEQHFLQVPEYQRPYSWEQEEAGTLLDDVLEFHGKGGTGGKDGMYFLGSFVLVGKSRRETRWKVLDGQQRLVTLTMILAAYRDMLSHQEGKDEVDRLIAFRKGGFILPRTTEYRVSLHDVVRAGTVENPNVESDNAFFRKYVQESGGISKLEQHEAKDEYPPVPSLRRIMENSLLLKRRLAQLHKDQPEHLKAVISRFLSRTFLVVAKTYSVENAFRIFTTLNIRGMDLAAKDYLKAEVIGSIPQEKQTEYAGKWDDLEAFLGYQESEGAGALNALLVHLASMSGAASAAESKQAELADIIKRRYRDKEKIWGAKFIDEVLYPYANALRVVTWADLNPLQGVQDNTKHTDNCNRQMKYLSQLCDSEDWIPLAMRLVLRWGVGAFGDTSHPDHDKLAAVLRSLERRAFAFTVLNAQSRTRQDVYSRLLHTLDSRNFEEVCSALDLTPQEKQRVIIRLEGPDFYHKKKVAKYVLLRLDETFSHAAGVYERLPETISIEHVLPQSPKGAWLTAFPNRKERNELTNAVGNLVLLPLPLNIDASNWSFADKFQRYFCPKEKPANPFAITTSLMQYMASGWTPDIIRRRGKELVDRCKDIWALK